MLTPTYPLLYTHARPPRLTIAPVHVFLCSEGGKRGQCLLKEADILRQQSEGG